MAQAILLSRLGVLDMLKGEKMATDIGRHFGQPLAIKKYFCNYCKKYTDHEIWSRPNKEGTGGDLTCKVCGSQRMDTIQGFNANLM